MKLKKYANNRFKNLIKMKNIGCYKIEGHFVDKQKPTDKLLSFLMAFKKPDNIFLTRTYRVDGLDNLDNIRGYLSKSHVDYIYSPPRKVKKKLGIVPIYNADTIHCLFEDKNVMKFLLDNFWYGCDTMDICLIKKENSDEVREMLVTKVGQDIEKMPPSNLFNMLNLIECLILKMWDGQSIEILTTKMNDTDMQKCVSLTQITRHFKI